MPVTIDTEKCDGCKSCEKECPTESLKVNGKAEVKPDDCIDCNACVDVCDKKAISPA